MSGTAERLGDAALAHVNKGGCLFADCALCRIAFAISIHPEWGGSLPMLWKDQLTDEEWSQYRHGEDPFKRAIRLAVLLEQQRERREAHAAYLAEAAKARANWDAAGERMRANPLTDG